MIQPLLSPTVGRLRREARQIWNGLFWVLPDDAAWHDLPVHYDPEHMFYARFRIYRLDGTSVRILAVLHLRLNALVLICRHLAGRHHPYAGLSGDS